MILIQGVRPHFEKCCKSGSCYKDSGYYFSSSPSQTCSGISKRLKTFRSGVSVMNIKLASSVSRLQEAEIKERHRSGD